MTATPELPTHTPPGDETLDVLLGGRVPLLQSRRGYRTAVDSVALAWFALRTAGLAGLVPRRAADLGAGSGLVAILLARSRPALSLALYELQEGLSQRAVSNLALNGLQARSSVVRCDLAEQAPAPGVDLAVCNPPFHVAKNHQPPANLERRVAHFESTATLQQLVHRAVGCLSPGGIACFVFPWAGLDRLLQACPPDYVRHVAALHHRPSDPEPVRALVALRRGALPPDCALALHRDGEPDSTFSQDLAAFVAALGLPNPAAGREPQTEEP